MSRHRWLKAEWPIVARTLGKQLRQRPFTEQSQSGFILDRVRDDFLEARHVERFEFDETVSDPFGKERTFARLEYRQTHFRTSAQWPGLELIDAPRSSQALVSELLEATNFALSVEPIGTDVMGWAEGIQELLKLKVEISSVQVGALQLDDGISAKVVVKGTNDVRASFRNLVADKRYTVEKVQFRVVRGTAIGTVLLANNASAKLDGQDLESEVLDAVRKALPRPVPQKK